MRTLAIGDIHGCSKALAALLRYVRPDPDDLLVFLGDYIDRGPDSRGVINQLLQVAGRCHTVFLRGNHEVMLLAAREDPLKASNWLSCGGLEALVSYEAQFRDDWRAGIPEPHWRFFETTVRAHETAHHIFVHAGLDHGADLEAQPDWLLFWAFWDQMQPHKSGKQVICGHTRQFDGYPSDRGFTVCIDTGAGVGGWLTCLDVNSGKYWQANERDQTREGSLRRVRS